uniref:Carbohydrate kinase PfkB domain-containing protein n=1 Tax=Oryza glumipatula TaxID=40148 RepID=A0A0D9ZV21_9ORYZ
METGFVFFFFRREYVGTTVPEESGSSQERRKKINKRRRKRKSSCGVRSSSTREFGRRHRRRRRRRSPSIPRASKGAGILPGAVYARQSLKFAAPVYVGDKVLVQVQAQHIRASTKHIVKFGTKCFTSDSDDLLAVDGEAMAVLPSLYLRQQLNQILIGGFAIFGPLNLSFSMAGATTTSSPLRRMESVCRHLLPASPPILYQNPLGAIRLESSPVIIGGMVLDIHAKPSMQPHPGTTVPGMENFLSPSWICQFRLHISTAPLLMLDANLSPDSLEAACKIAHESGVPVFFEPVSLAKGSRIAPIAKYITYTSPNEIELVAMANSLSPPEKYTFVKMEQSKNKAKAVEYLFEMLSPAMFFLLEKGIKFLLVTLGSNGVFVCCKESTSLMDQRKSEMMSFSTPLLQKLERCFPSNMLVDLPREGSSRTCVFHFPAVSASVVSLTGAGDCFVGGVISALCGGLGMMQSVAVGIAIAKSSVESEANIPDKFSAATIADDARRTLLSAKMMWCK